MGKSLPRIQFSAAVLASRQVAGHFKPQWASKSAVYEKRQVIQDML
jgi:hypothetical protein